MKTIRASHRANTETITAKGWVPIRESEGHLWMSLGEVSPVIEMARAKSTETDSKCGATWALFNPVVAYRRVTITTDEE